MQEAYFAGSFPHDRQKSRSKDLSNRLVAKFKLDLADFWDKDFRPLSDAALKPHGDDMEKFLDDIGLVND